MVYSECNKNVFFFYLAACIIQLIGFNTLSLQMISNVANLLNAV